MMPATSLTTAHAIENLPHQTLLRSECQHPSIDPLAATHGPVDTHRDVSPTNAIARDERLSQRGIALPASAMGWQHGTGKQKRGWTYPVYDFTGTQVAVRYKAYNSRATPKYLWVVGNATYYHVGAALRDAIATSGGVLYIVNGEPAVLAFHAAGLLNVLSFFGESNLSDTLVADLRALGVQTVRYSPDKDKAGAQAAVKLRDALHNSGITLECRSLPDNLPAKADTNDLWQHLKFDALVFQAALTAAPDYPLPAPAAPSTLSTPKRTPSQRAAAAPTANAPVDWDALRELWWTLVVLPRVEAAAPVVKGRGKYARRHCPNPAHPDKHPSFRISYEKATGGLPMCSCDVHYERDPRGLVASWVGAPDFMTWFKAERMSLLARPSGVPAPYKLMKNPRQARAGYTVQHSMSSSQAWWDGGVPNTWRTLLLTYYPSTVAMVVELLNRAFCLGTLNPTAFTRQDFHAWCHEQGYELSNSTSHDAFQLLCGQLIRKLTINEISDYEVNFRIKSKRGRPVEVYAAYSLSEAKVRVLGRVQVQLEDKIYAEVEKHRKLTPQHLQALDADEDEAKAYAAQLAHLKLVTEDEARELDRVVVEQFCKLEDRLNWRKSSPLPEAIRFRNAKEYRAAYLRAIVEADPEKPRGNGYFMARLGASKNTVASAMKRAYVRNEPQFLPAEPIDLDIPYEQQLMSAPGQYTYSLCWMEGDDYVEKRFDGEGWIWDEGRARWKRGKEVFVIRQTVNRQVLYEIGSAQFLEELPPKEEQMGSRKRGKQRVAIVEEYHPKDIVKLLWWLLLNNGWVKDRNQLRNTKTGEILSNNTEPLELVRRLAENLPVDLIAFAGQELDAEVSELETSSA